jgi:HAD superfamily phosphoserine phosphatase-like hydrolase
MKVGFDFDKTLTFRDTSLGFYKICSKSNARFFLFFPFYFLCSILYKFKIISNDQLKHVAVQIFLRGLSLEQFHNKCKQYSKKIEFNNILTQLDYYKEKGCAIYIITASFSSYISELFSGLPVHVIGSELVFKNNRVNGVKINCFGKKKVDELKKCGVHRLDVFYTDSYSDYPLIMLSKKSFLVKKHANNHFIADRICL